MTKIDTLLAIEDIKRLKARYFRSLDTKDWERFAAVFAEDVLFDVTEAVPDARVVGRDEVLTFVRAIFADASSVHHGLCPEIDVSSESTASGIWAMEDKLFWKESSGSAISRLHGMGHYIETYEKGTTGWQIKTVRLTRLRTMTWDWNGNIVCNQ